MVVGVVVIVSVFIVVIMAVFVVVIMAVFVVVIMAVFVVVIMAVFVVVHFLREGNVLSGWFCMNFREDRAFFAERHVFIWALGDEVTQVGFEH